MKKLVIWLAKRYAIKAVQDAVKAHGEEVKDKAAKMGEVVGCALAAIGCLETFRLRIADGELSDEEAAATVDEIKRLAQELATALAERKENGGSWWPTVLAAILGAALAAACAICAGCSTGVSISLNDSTGVAVGNIAFEETVWPMVSMHTGPTFKFWACREAATGAVERIVLDGSATVTNTTSALGIYESTEAKTLNVRMGEIAK